MEDRLRELNKTIELFKKEYDLLEKEKPSLEEVILRLNLINKQIDEKRRKKNQNG